jgi:hypothetical protein
MCSVRQAAAVFALALVLRMNAFYRGEVRRLLRPLDQDHPDLGSRGQRCVVAHIRRGDRLILGADPVEYCRNLTAKLPCVRPDGGFGPCDVHMGCGEGVPFSLLGLSHVLEKVPALLPDGEGDGEGAEAARTVPVVLLSDDVRWLRAEIDRVHQAQQVQYSEIEIPVRSAPPRSWSWSWSWSVCVCRRRAHRVAGAC